jgi:hypothetical protein
VGCEGEGGWEGKGGFRNGRKMGGRGRKKGDLRWGIIMENVWALRDGIVRIFKLWWLCSINLVSGSISKIKYFLNLKCSLASQAQSTLPPNLSPPPKD